MAQQPQQWEFSVTPYLWIAGVTGTLKTPNPQIPAQSMDAGFGDLLSHLNAIPFMGATELRYGRFGVMADLMAISVKSDLETKGILFRGGDVRLTQVIGTAAATYRLVDTAGQSLDLGVGVRAFGLSTKFTLDPGLLPGLSRSPGSSWADPIGVARYHAALGPRWGLTAYADVGGGPDSRFTWQALGTVDYRIANSTTMRLGYRYLRFQYSTGALRQNMGMGGPIIGATIRF